MFGGDALIAAINQSEDDLVEIKRDTILRLDLVETDSVPAGEVGCTNRLVRRERA